MNKDSLSHLNLILGKGLLSLFTRLLTCLLGWQVDITAAHHEVSINYRLINFALNLIQLEDPFATRQRHSWRY